MNKQTIENKITAINEMRKYINEVMPKLNEFYTQNKDKKIILASSHFAKFFIEGVNTILSENKPKSVRAWINKPFHRIDVTFDTHYRLSDDSVSHIKEYLDIENSNPNMRCDFTYQEIANKSVELEGIDLLMEELKNKRYNAKSGYYHFFQN